MKRAVLNIDDSLLIMPDAGSDNVTIAEKPVSADQLRKSVLAGLTYLGKSATRQTASRKATEALIQAIEAKNG